ncbi:MAG: hypothetical protein OXP66_16925 [Candidatus Tectomicrobia bacterium]|nr:hypothetical protein [Candidatus Tectomicrobia bacterium]
MNEGLQRVANYQTAGVFSQPFCAHLLAFISHDVIDFIGVTDIWMAFFGVRQCRTAVPHNRTALAEKFGVEGGVRRTVP